MEKTLNKKWWPIVFSVLLLVPANLSAGQDITPEEVRASYILKLRPFVTMGNPAHIMETICYYEKPGVPLNESVGQILGKYVQTNPAPDGKPLAVKRFQAIRNLTGCDALYIPADEESNIDNILTALDSSPTLTISAANRFIMRGGMLGFVLDDANRVKMEANLENLKKQGVKIDAQILEIMQQVVGQN
jgi:hypothetical protein